MDTVESAYREVFGNGLPARWRRRIETECTKGDGHALEAITAGTIRGGQAAAHAAKKTFGPGWVFRFAADQAATARARRRRQKL